jgi:hypothetical protein
MKKDKRWDLGYEAGFMHGKDFMKGKRNKLVKRKPFTYSFAELIDKLSIVSRKDVYGLPGARAELDLIMSWLTDAGIDAYTLLSIIRITQANADIWNKEHEIRNASLGELPLSVVGKAAEQVREHNKTRVRYMNELSLAVGDSQVLEKVRHLSEEIYDKYYRESKRAKS